ncbi:NAD(+) diphosphatase [Tomitella biformata]|uniref:NAD(+) diphosphatase n=1 Tax=Tomitella biformata TaxID=630403 RepID=UPI000463E21C|nr:NAD(+) diphosphatase [Tomitella biformata]
MSEFELHSPPLLSRDPLDRPLGLREDDAQLDAGWPSARVLRLSARGKVRTDGSAVLYEDALEVAPDRPAGAVLLGIEDGRHMWAISDPRMDSAPIPGEMDGAVQLGDLRTHGVHFAAVDTARMVAAQAVLNWHHGAKFCARDGAPTVLKSGGWVSVCEKCEREEYPRTDPAIICLVHDGADRVLLARQGTWPKRMFSILAGFVEAGESLEACVEREIMEEVGVQVSDVRYLGSQPWPFPRSVMLGFHATGDPSTPLVFSDGEIGEAEWFTRAQVRASLAQGDWADDGQTRPMLPGSVSIARGILEAWAALD